MTTWDLHCSVDEADRLYKRCAHLEVKLAVAKGALRVAEMALQRAVEREADLERQVASLAGDLLIDRAFNGPGAA